MIGIFHKEAAGLEFHGNSSHKATACEHRNVTNLN